VAAVRRVVAGDLRERGAVAIGCGALEQWSQCVQLLWRQ
jgi:hypothetical protein